MSAQHQCLLRSLFLPVPQVGLLLSLIQMNIENKSALILGQVRLGKERLIPHLGHSIMRGCRNKWMVFWSGNETALASGQSSEEQLHPTILP